MEMPAAQPQTQVQTQTQPAPVKPQAPKSRRGCVTCLIITLVILLLLTCCCSCSLFGMLSLAGAKGQPGTILKPSGGSSGTKMEASSLAIPTGLKAAATDAAIKLDWDSISDAKNIRIYRSEKPGQGFTKLDKVESPASNYKDGTAKKGTTYYYVITALASSGAESANSAQVAAVIDVAPLVPKGIYSWKDVKAKADADAEYLRVLTKVTGMTMSDVNREVEREKAGQSIKVTLLKGTIITNTMEDYRIVPNFTLTYDREALCDANEIPRVLTKCGNPMKTQAPVTPTAVLIQQVQIFITNVVMIFPPNVTNVLINTGQSANNVMVAVIPTVILVDFGPDFSPPPPTVFVDPATFGDDLYDPETDINLEEGQQWINEGKLLITANPPDPAPSQSVTMTVRIFPAEAGVMMDYSMVGTDGYSTSGTGTTDKNGEFSFTIPGGGAEVHDTVTVTVPSKSNLGGTVEYTF
ncbi:MAG: hypothetical protein WC891_04205 [Actinomycetota bacterium]